MNYDSPLSAFIAIFTDGYHHGYNDIIGRLLDTIAEIAVPVAAILLIIWLLRHWKK